MCVLGHQSSVQHSYMKITRRSSNIISDDYTANTIDFTSEMAAILQSNMAVTLQLLVFTNTIAIHDVMHIVVIRIVMHILDIIVLFVRVVVNIVMVIRVYHCVLDILTGILTRILII